LNSLPDWLVLKLEPSFYLHIQVQKDFEKTITQLKDGTEEIDASHPTLFNEMLNSDLPDSDKTVLRLQQEAQVIIGAAILTTSWAMSVVSFHLANEPRIADRARAELDDAFSDYSSSLEWSQLEILPYLSGIVREGIRLAYGIASRLPRVAHRDGKFREWTIPGGTPISMTIVDMNHNESVFPQSFEFRPERWLDRPEYNGNSLDKYFVGFGKGARSCVGMNLALSLLYTTLATLIRRYDFELFETDESDVRLAHDYFMPMPKLDTKGVRMKVRAASKD
jgi:cytochrome P450